MVCPRDCENSKMRAQSSTIQDSVRKLTNLRADKLTELIVVEFLLTLQPHGHVAYCSFTRWLRVSRQEFQYVAPTHDDAARSMAAPVPLDAFMAILWSVSCTIYAVPAQSPLSDSRFTKLSSTEELDQLCTPFVPQQTKNNNTWAQGVFKNWLLCRNASKDPTIEKFPVDILQTHYETIVVDRALAAFVLEAMRMDGNYYPGTTIRNILSAIHKANLGAVNVKSFIDKKERERFYPQLNSGLDHQLRMLRMNGIGVERKCAQVITPAIEQQLWIKGILGLHSPLSLLNTVFFFTMGRTSV